MYRMTLILIILAWPLLIFGQEKKAAANKLKSVTVYEQKYEKGPGKSLIESLIRYDQSGNITEEIEYKLGKVDKHLTYEYDADNNKIRETEFDPAGKKIKVTEYKYSNNLRTEKIVYDGNKQILSKKTYKYELY
jgi:hypothetical protein